MIEQIHKHITSELAQNTRTDVIFILTAIVFNLVILGVNSGLSEPSRTDNTLFFVMVIFDTLIIIINLVALVGLLKGRETRSKLLGGLIKMYKDQQVDQYYDSSLLRNYNLRYNLFILVVLFTGLISLVVPFVVR